MCLPSISHNISITEKYNYHLILLIKENRDTEMLSNFPKGTQLVSIQTKAVFFQSLSL